VILVVMGWMALIPVTLQRIFSLGVVVALFALSLITPWWVIRPAFAPPIFLNTDEVAARTAPNSPVFNGQIKLLRAELGTLTPHSSAGQANAQLPLTLYWGAQQPIDQSYRVEVRVVEADTGNVIGQLRALPNHGRFATNRWPIGQYFRDDYTLVISATQPHIARVELRLFQQYPQPGYVKLINDSDVFLIEHVRVGPLLPHDPAAANAAQAFFGEGIALMASQVNTDTLELSWRCRDAPHNDYTLFVHVFDANNNVLAEYDGQPQQGEAPTSLWMPNDVYADRRPISLPPNAARIQIGWYDPATGARLPATHPDGSRWPDDAVVIWERKP